MAKIDDLFFELGVKRGAGTDQAIGKFTQSLRKLGQIADAAADDLDDLAGSTDKADKEAKQATTTFGRLFKRLRGAAGAITAVSTGFLAARTIFLDVFRAVRGLIVGFGNLVTRGGEVTNVARAFTRVVGDQQAALTELRAATQGLIGDFDLMVQFNRAIALGSATSTAEFAKLSEVALTLGRALGVDAAFALESLNLGIGRQSRLILDNLGLIISVEQANLDYAVAVGKSVEQLSLQERRQAFVNAALSAAEEKIEELGGTQLTAADNLQQLNVAFINFRDGLAIAIANSPVVAQAISALTEAFQSLFGVLERLIGIEEVVDADTFVDLAALEEIILFFRTLPAEFDVLVAKVRLVTESIATFFARAFGGVIDSQEDLLRTLAEKFIGFSDLLVNRFNPAIQLAAAGAAEFLERLGDAAAEGEGFAANAERRLAAARAELTGAEEILDATRARALAEVNLSRVISARRAERGADGIDVQAGLAAFQALQEAFDAATVTAAQKSLEAVEQLEAAFVDAFGEIPKEAEAQLGKLRALAEEALSEARAKELGARFARSFSEGLQEIDISVLTGGLTDEAAQQARLDLLEAQRAEIEAAIVANKNNAASVRELNKLLGTVLKSQKRITDEVEDTAAARAKRELKAIEDALKAQQATIGLIQQAASGAADLGNAFGIVSDETQRVIDNVIQLGGAIASVITQVQALQQGVGSLASALSGALGAIGAIAGLLGGLFGGGPSPETLARNRTLEQNNKALQDLGRSVDDLRGSFDISGAQISGLLKFFQQRGGLAGELGGIIGALLEGLDPTALTRALAEFGLTLGDLEDVAEELGITIRDEAGNIIPAALDQLQEALLALEDTLIGFADNISGAFARFRAEIEIFDIEDAGDQFRLLQERLLDIQEIDAEEFFRIMNDSTLGFIERIAALQEAFDKAGRQITPFLAELLAIDVSTAEGRARADELIRSLFTQLAEGVLSPEDLGAATFEEAIQILLEMEGLLDTIAEESEEGAVEQEGQTQSINRQVQITELQAAQLLAFQATQTELLRQIRDALRGGVPITAGAGFEEALQEAVIGPPGEVISPPPIGPPAEGGGGGGFEVAGGAPEMLIGEVTINAQISVGAGATPDQAEEVREILLDDIEVELGNRLINAQRQTGLPRITRERLPR